ncbi:Fic family protein [Patescibacteria group bacterium]|nr:Fic family protein [Patescibacteria group bacterium]
MNTPVAQHPFKKGFISAFTITFDMLPFTDKEMKLYDQKLTQFEQFFLNPDIEKYLISKNELLTSYAISKAELSSLTYKEAQDVYGLVLANPDYDFAAEKLKKGKKLTSKDYDKLEFFNIAKTFRFLNQNPFSVEDLNPQLIQALHRKLTQGLDIFKNHLTEFTVYKSGSWRDNDEIRVGNYAPAPYKEIEVGVKELINWLKNNRNITGLAVFHTALYGLHPFNNGNKRVCRITEHILLRQLGMNQKNLYSTSYYFHKEKPRYYKYLLYSLERKNLNHFVSFIQEAIMFSMISVIKTSLEAKRDEYLKKQTTDLTVINITKPLIKRKELQFKHLFKPAAKKMARQTFVTYLQKAVDNQIIIKRKMGRSTFYSLNLEIPEEKTISEWLNFFKKKLGYIPDEFSLV